jgi:hypothetical protein
VDIFDVNVQTFLKHIGSVAEVTFMTFLMISVLYQVHPESFRTAMALMLQQLKSKTEDLAAS